MLPSQALRSPGDPAHNPGQGDEAINKPSTSCAPMKTAPMMTRSNTWNFNSVTDNDGRDEIFATLDIALRNGAREGDATLKVKVDTGDQGNILPVRTFKRMYPELLDESGVPSKRHLGHRPTTLTAYNGAAMTQHGTIVIPCSYGKRQCDIEFYVVGTPGPVYQHHETSIS